MRCPKCSGCLHYEQAEYGEPWEARCLNCSWRENKPLALPPEHRGRKSEGKKTGAQLPCVQEAKR